MNVPIAKLLKEAIKLKEKGADLDLKLNELNKKIASSNSQNVWIEEKYNYDNRIVF